MRQFVVDRIHPIFGIIFAVFLVSLASGLSSAFDVVTTSDSAVEIPEKQNVDRPESGESPSTGAKSAPMVTPFRVAVIGATIIGGAIVLALLLVFPDGRRFLVKHLYLVRNLLGVDVGLRGVVQLGLYSALPAVAVAFAQGYRESSKRGFDWHAFWTVFLVVTAVGILANIINRSMTLRRVLSPGAGRVWRSQRKSATAGIIQRINCHIIDGSATVEEVRKILRDILDVIVLHVRDHRGNFRNDRPEVFGNLLLEDGADLIVVARDSFSHSSQYQRQIPAKYPKATMLCGRAIERRKVLSVGVLTQAYPEGPRNKPYQSILAIPLFGAKGDTPYGVLSIDCSRPYFFESFVPGQVENDLENNLQPYVHLITLTLEALVSSDRSVVVSKLAKAPSPVRPNGGEP